MSPYWLATILSLAFITRATIHDCNLDGFVAPQQPVIESARTVSLNFSQHQWGYPVGIAACKHRDVAFVSLGRNETRFTSLVVLDTSQFLPKVITHYPYPPKEVGPEGGLEIVLSTNDTYLYVASGYGAFIVDVDRAIKNEANPFVGFLNGTTGKQHPGDAAFAVAATKDNDYVFILQEYGSGKHYLGNVDVFKVDSQSGPGNVTGTPVNSVTLGDAVTDIVSSPQEDRFYVVSEVFAAFDTKKSPPGSISVLDASLLEQTPSKSLLGNITTECNPTRAILSKDGSTLWIANRASNTVLVLNTSEILSNPSNARIASIDVGTAPDGLLFVRDETRLLVANTNRFHNRFTPDYIANASAGISVIDVEAALQNSSSANLGQISAGIFPRDWSITADGKTAYLTDTFSQQITIIDVDSIP